MAERSIAVGFWPGRAGSLLPLLFFLVGACQPTSRAPDLILISLDTLRWDHLGTYGHASIQTPTLDALAREGVVFDRAYTSFNLTLPAHLSLMTGLKARRHGGVTNSIRLSPQVPTLAGALAARGYDTAAAVSVTHLNPPVSGLGPGFEQFSSSPPPERRADATWNSIQPWLLNEGRAPRFLWLHLFDPHAPYTPPPPLDTQLYRGDARAAGRPLLLDHPAYRQGHYRSIFRHWLAGVTDPEYPKALYQGEVSFADQVLGDVIGTLKRQGRYTDALIAVLADHGESLGEHGIPYAHNDVYEPTVRIPLILKLPRGRFAGTRTRALVETTDLTATLLEVLKLPPFPSQDGRSVLPMLEGAAPAPREELVIESRYPPAQVLIAGDWKLVMPAPAPGGESVAGAGEVRLVPLDRDPEELENWLGRAPEQARRLAARLTAWQHDRTGTFYGPEQPQSPDLEREVLEQLKALGYVQ